MKEVERAEEDIVEVDMRGGCVVVNEVKLKVDLTKYAERHCFTFDEALDEGVSNDVVYRVTVAPLVHTLFANGKATCFAYGQTGSGKTYTMSPLPIRAAADILAHLRASPELRDVGLFVSCFEIYGNKVFDLLNMRKKLNILEDGKRKVVVVGLKVSTWVAMPLPLGLHHTHVWCGSRPPPPSSPPPPPPPPPPHQHASC
jgi:kinesin family member 2/24